MVHSREPDHKRTCNLTALLKVYILFKIKREGFPSGFGGEKGVVLSIGIHYTSNVESGSAFQRGRGKNPMRRSSREACETSERDTSHAVLETLPPICSCAEAAIRYSFPARGTRDIG